jgi:DnaJ-class molecular chaperone
MANLPNPTPKIQQQRKPGDGEAPCDKCNGTGRVDAHVCTKCWGSGVMNEDGSPIRSNGSGSGSSNDDS